MAKRLRRVEQVERNRERVLGTARRVFLEKGYAGSSLDAIADAAGFSKGVVYSQFGSKADLFLALLERRIERRAAENQRSAAERQGVEGLLEVLRAGARDAATERGWARLLIEFRALAAHDPALNRRYAAAHGRAVEQLAEVVEGLRAVPPFASPRAVAEFVFAIASGITLERMANPSALRDDDIVALLTRTFESPPSDDVAARAAREGTPRARTRVS